MTRLAALARRQRVLPWFAGTRIALFLLVTGIVPYFNQGAVYGDVRLYGRWSTGRSATGPSRTSCPRA